MGITKKGPTSQYEIQKKKGLRLREEGSKISRDTLRRSLGLLRGGVVGQSLSISQGTFVGQSPRSDKGNAVRPTETICWADQRVEFTGRLAEKEKGAVNPNFAYLHRSGTLMVEEGGC